MLKTLGLFSLVVVSIANPLVLEKKETLDVQNLDEKVKSTRLTQKVGTTASHKQGKRTKRHMTLYQ